MIGHREFTVDDYLTILRRRLWVILVPAILGPVLAYGVSLALPERFTSTTLVLVEGQKVPENFVRSIVTDELNSRIATMRELVFSRTRLEPIIEKYGLYKEAQGKVAIEDLVLRLRNSIEVTPIKPILRSRSEEVPGFNISVTASEAKTAQMICSEVTSLFLSENLRSREQTAMGTTEFLQKQLGDAKNKLNEQDTKLAAFKQRYVNLLPGQEQTNLNLLVGLNTQLDAVTQALNRAQQDKTYMESLLAQQITAWEASKTGSNPETLEQQLAKKEGELVALRARYKDEHPDVVAAKNDIEQLRQKIEAAKGAQAKKTDRTDDARPSEPAPILQLRGQIHNAEVVIREKTREQDRLQEQIKIYQARVQSSPLVEQQYKELTRDYDTALAFYNDLLNKTKQSEVAEDLERRQQGEQFRITDSANLPAKPSFPNRRLFAGGGLAGGLALGVGLALLLEFQDKSIRNERDVEALLGVTTLAQIPFVGEANGRRNRPGKLGRRAEPASVPRVTA